MLGRKDYRVEELAAARAAVEAQLTAYRALADAVAATGDPAAGAALAALEPVLFGNLVLTLDRFFVHRVRPVTGKDPNPLNEVELLAEALVVHDGVLTTNKVIKYAADRTVLGLAPGERVRLGVDDFDRLAAAYLAELETRFVAPASAEA
jgi:hypothetical protein